jgi:hypothetical protein
MVQVGIEIVIVIVLLILSIGLQLEARFSAKDYLEGYDADLQEMRNSLNVVAEVLKQLPSLVPQFSINENPLSQILQFFQQRAEQQDTSLAPPTLRDDQGQYSNGTKETKETSK